jgi:phosphoglycerate dehydrogenase-like enzyme
MDIIWQRGKKMIISFTAKISQKHQQNLKETFPLQTFQFFDKIEQMGIEDFKNTEVLVTYGEDLTSAYIDLMEKLQWIQVLSAGLERMPFEAMTKRNILVTNARGIHQIPMAEYTLGMVLQLVRKGYELYDLQKEGIWDRSLRLGEAYGKTIGIVGLGAIGTEIAMRAKAFGMKVVGLKRDVGDLGSLRGLQGVGTHLPEYVDEIVSYKEKEKLFIQSDFVVILLPLTSETNKFIGLNELQMMKSSAYLINIARGEVVKEEDLIHALRGKMIAGAVLDVFEQEPLPGNHPFWELDNVMITPHVSGRSPLYMQRALDIFCKNIKAYPEREAMTNMIDLIRGY